MKINNQDTVSHTFGPIFDENSRYLILGSMPSVKSRDMGFYYMHKQNRFWKVLSAVFDDDFEGSIEDKKAKLLKHNIALYDVIESCKIIGSSDVSIKDVVPANKTIDVIIEKSKIEKIILNGSKAAKLFDKFFKYDGIDVLYMPSTSPANAKMNLEILVKSWINIK